MILDLYCGCVEATETACYEQNIIELWGDQVRNETISSHHLYLLLQGTYSEESEKKIASLSKEDILNTINNRNVSQIFMKDFNFKELLGDVKYNYKGEVIGKLWIKL